MFFKRGPKVPSVDAETLKRWIDDGKDMILLDVRTDQEWKQTGIIPGSLMIPNFKLIAQMQSGLDLNKGKPVIAICRSGSRSKKVTEYLRKLDIDAINLEGGMIAWYNQQYEVERV